MVTDISMTYSLSYVSLGANALHSCSVWTKSGTITRLKSQFFAVENTLGDELSMN